jgi:ADP-ribose pyrophosphatase YjhB (NUDIX family)
MNSTIAVLSSPKSRNFSREARPKVAIDIVLFAVVARQLVCYLVQLKNNAAGKWAFPGRLVRVGELLDEAARDELANSTGLRDPYLEQLFTFGDPTRDPRAHVVSVAYMALTDNPEGVVSCSHRYSGGQWFATDDLPPLAYDHGMIAEYAVKRLKSKLEYTNIACNLLPRIFTFAQLEELYSAILERDLDRRNFRRRVLAMGLLRQLGMERRGCHRPAALYEFTQRSLQVIEML